MANKIKKNILSVEKLSVQLQGKTIFKGLNLLLQHTGKCVIYGKSGCGKSTFLQTLMGFIPVYSGKIFFNETILLSPQTVHSVRQLTAWVPQETSLQFTTAKEIFDTIFSFKNNRHLLADKNTVTTTLQSLNLPEDILTNPYSALSGGEKQRLLIAAGLLQQKPLLLLDEPTSALDASNRKAVVEAIKNYPYASIIVSHDEELIKSFEKHLNFEHFTV